ncbi:hypothetical protein FNF28_00362 [Cafeteria roenbergensis]|uniref:Uncharacterized protein n=1 Tax=Cafeteria roenbergensis TaxID=33653 RepID=A0A5A8E2K9_CAFRO|nr:hypothetical protein FNF28_00362 [Cafeteria roenbergensis]
MVPDSPLIGAAGVTPLVPSGFALGATAAHEDDPGASRGVGPRRSLDAWADEDEGDGRFGDADAPSQQLGATGADSASAGAAASEAQDAGDAAKFADVEGIETAPAPLSVADVSAAALARSSSVGDDAASATAAAAAAASAAAAAAAATVASVAAAGTEATSEASGANAASVLITPDQWASLDLFSGGWAWSGDSGSARQATPGSSDEDGQLPADASACAAAAQAAQADLDREEHRLFTAAMALGTSAQRSDLADLATACYDSLGAKSVAPPVLPGTGGGSSALAASASAPATPVQATPPLAPAASAAAGESLAIPDWGYTLQVLARSKDMRRLQPVAWRSALAARAERAVAAVLLLHAHALPEAIEHFRAVRRWARSAGQQPITRSQPRQHPPNPPSALLEAFSAARRIREWILEAERRTTDKRAAAKLAGGVLHRALCLLELRPAEAWRLPPHVASGRIPADLQRQVLTFVTCHGLAIDPIVSAVEVRATSSAWRSSLAALRPRALAALSSLLPASQSGAGIAAGSDSADGVAATASDLATGTGVIGVSRHTTDWALASYSALALALGAADDPSHAPVHARHSPDNSVSPSAAAGAAAAGASAAPAVADGRTLLTRVVGECRAVARRVAASAADGAARAQLPPLLTLLLQCVRGVHGPERVAVASSLAGDLVAAAQALHAARPRALDEAGDAEQADAGQPTDEGDATEADDAEDGTPCVWPVTVASNLEASAFQASDGVRAPVPRAVLDVTTACSARGASGTATAHRALDLSTRRGWICGALSRPDSSAVEPRIVIALPDWVAGAFECLEVWATNDPACPKELRVSCWSHKHDLVAGAEPHSATWGIVGNDVAPSRALAMAAANAGISGPEQDVLPTEALGGARFSRRVVLRPPRRGRSLRNELGEEDEEDEDGAGNLPEDDVLDSAPEGAGRGRWVSVLDAFSLVKSGWRPGLPVGFVSLNVRANRAGGTVTRLAGVRVWASPFGPGLGEGALSATVLDATLQLALAGLQRGGLEVASSPDRPSDADTSLTLALGPVGDALSDLEARKATIGAAVRSESGLPGSGPSAQASAARADFRVAASLRRAAIIPTVRPAVDVGALAAGFGACLDLTATGMSSASWQSDFATILPLASAIARRAEEAQRRPTVDVPTAVAHSALPTTVPEGGSAAAEAGGEGATRDASMERVNFFEAVASDPGAAALVLQPRAEKEAARAEGLGGCDVRLSLPVVASRALWSWAGLRAHTVAPGSEGMPALARGDPVVTSEGDRALIRCSIVDNSLLLLGAEFGGDIRLSPGSAERASLASGAASAVGVLVGQVRPSPFFKALVSDAVAAIEAGAAAVTCFVAVAGDEAAPVTSALGAGPRTVAELAEAAASAPFSEVLRICMGVAGLGAASGCIVSVAPAVGALALERAWTNLTEWMEGLEPGSPLDALLPVGEAWGRARVVARAPAPFRRCMRVAFEGLGLEFWRWVAWEGCDSATIGAGICPPVHSATPKSFTTSVLSSAVAVEGSCDIRWLPDEMAPPGWVTGPVVCGRDRVDFAVQWRARALSRGLGTVDGGSSRHDHVRVTLPHWLGVPDVEETAGTALRQVPAGAYDNEYHDLCGVAAVARDPDSGHDPEPDVLEDLAPLAWPDPRRGLLGRGDLAGDGAAPGATGKGAGAKGDDDPSWPRPAQAVAAAAAAAAERAARGSAPAVAAGPPGLQWAVQDIPVMASAADAESRLLQWRVCLKPGDRVDCFDSHNKWYEGVVIDSNEEVVTVRFIGWSPRSLPGRYDENIHRLPRGDSDPRLLPPTCKIRDWRRVQLADDVEIREGRVVENTTVSAIDQALRRVRVAHADDWHQLGNPYDLAAHSTHQRPAQWANIDRESFLAPPPVPPLPVQPAAPALTALLAAASARHAREASARSLARAGASMAAAIRGDEPCETARITFSAWLRLPTEAEAAPALPWASDAAVAHAAACYPWHGTLCEQGPSEAFGPAGSNRALSLLPAGTPVEAEFSDRNWYHGLVETAAKVSDVQDSSDDDNDDDDDDVDAEGMGGGGGADCGRLDEEDDEEEDEEDDGDQYDGDGYEDDDEQDSASDSSSQGGGLAAADRDEAVGAVDVAFEDGDRRSGLEPGQCDTPVRSSSVVMMRPDAALVHAMDERKVDGASIAAGGGARCLLLHDVQLFAVALPPADVRAALQGRALAPRSGWEDSVSVVDVDDAATVGAASGLTEPDAPSGSQLMSRLPPWFTTLPRRAASGAERSLARQRERIWLWGAAEATAASSLSRELEDDQVLESMEPAAAGGGPLAAVPSAHMLMRSKGGPTPSREAGADAAAVAGLLSSPWLSSRPVQQYSSVPEMLRARFGDGASPRHDASSAAANCEPASPARAGTSRGAGSRDESLAPSQGPASRSAGGTGLVSQLPSADWLTARSDLDSGATEHWNALAMLQSRAGLAAVLGSARSSDGSEGDSKTRSEARPGASADGSEWIRPMLQFMADAPDLGSAADEAMRAAMLQSSWRPLAPPPRHPRQTQRGTGLQARGLIVWVDVYDQRLPAVVDREIERRPEIRARLLPGPRCGDLAGTTVHVAVTSAYVRVPLGAVGAAAGAILALGAPLGVGSARADGASDGEVDVSLKHILNDSLLLPQALLRGRAGSEEACPTASLPAPLPSLAAQASAMADACGSPVALRVDPRAGALFLHDDPSGLGRGPTWPALLADDASRISAEPSAGGLVHHHHHHHHDAAVTSTRAGADALATLEAARIVRALVVSCGVATRDIAGPLRGLLLRTGREHARAVASHAVAAAVEGAASLPDFARVQAVGAGCASALGPLARAARRQRVTEGRAMRGVAPSYRTYTARKRLAAPPALRGLGQHVMDASPGLFVVDADPFPLLKDRLSHPRGLREAYAWLAEAAAASLGVAGACDPADVAAGSTASSYRC